MSPEPRPALITRELLEDDLNYRLLLILVGLVPAHGDGKTLESLIQELKAVASERLPAAIAMNWKPGPNSQAQTKRVSRVLDLGCKRKLLTKNARQRINYYGLTPKGQQLRQEISAGNHHHEREAFIDELLKVYLPPQDYQLVHDSLFPEDHQRLRTLKNYLRIIPRELRFSESPGFDADILDDLVSALDRDRQIRVEYQSRAEDKPSERELNPLWLVLRDGTIYLLATPAGKRFDPADIRQYASHRIHTLQIHERNAVVRPLNYSVDDYIASHGFDYLLGERDMTLELRFTPDCWYNPREHKLSAGQTEVEAEDGIRVSVPDIADTVALRRWLLGMGEYVEVLGPPPLRAAFRATSEQLWQCYHPDR